MQAAKRALKHSALTEKIIGVFYSVYNELGPGFLESVYQRSMGIALCEAGLTAELEVPVPVWFHDRQVGDFRADLVVDRLVLLELKTAQAIDPAHEGQILHYLRATDFEVGLLLNFGPQPHFKRFILENSYKRKSVKSVRSVRSVVSSS